jgi:anti-anti-sigma factor
LGKGNVCYRILTFGGGNLRYLSLLMQPVRLDLTTESSSNNGAAITRLEGRLSLETVHYFIETLRPEPAEHLVLDMSGVTFLDSAGVGALVSLFVSRKHHGKTFALAALNPQGSAVLEVAGLFKLLPIYRSVEEAVAKPA